VSAEERSASGSERFVDGSNPRPEPILMLINGRDIRIHATTGQLLRELILNPAVDYQARGVRKPRPKPS
jgi:hypothetical protein